MIAIAPSRLLMAPVLGAVIGVLASLFPPPAIAEGRLKAHYTISMTGVSIGQIVWIVAIGDQRYTTSANGKASGVLSMLVNGEGAVDVRGTVVDGRLAPRFFTSAINDDEGKSELRMSFDETGVKDLVGQAPPPGKDRVPVREADRRGVTDPLSAMLIPADDDAFAAANCDRVLPVFDGRRRYDLSLTFKRIDKVKLAHSYSGAVLVCGVILRPIAGYRADSMLVKYVAGRRDMELWFAPIAGTAVIAPIRVSMPTLLGTLEIEADQFDAVAVPVTPPPNMAPR